MIFAIRLSWFVSRWAIRLVWLVSRFALLPLSITAVFLLPLFARNAAPLLRPRPVLGVFSVCAPPVGGFGARPRASPRYIFNII